MGKFKTNEIKVKYRFRLMLGGVKVIDFNVSKPSIGIIVLKNIEESIVKFKIKILVEYSFHFN